MARLIFADFNSVMHHLQPCSHIAFYTRPRDLHSQHNSISQFYPLSWLSAFDLYLAARGSVSRMIRAVRTRDALVLFSPIYY